MAKRSTPRRRVVDGQEFVVLSVVDYERLDAARRQVGATTSRLRSMTHELGEAAALLTAIEGYVCDAGRPGVAAPLAADDEWRRDISEIIRSYRG